MLFFSHVKFTERSIPASQEMYKFSILCPLTLAMGGVADTKGLVTSLKNMLGTQNAPVTRRLPTHLSLE